MASGTIRITNIPVSASGFDYTLGATATWSTTRSGNTVTVSGKVTTDEQGGYPFDSTYAINCTLVWGGDVKHNIVIKAADNGSSIFSRSQTYTKSFTVNSTQTSISMSVVINHTNNPNSSGSGSGTITFPAGWTNISYTKKPVPIITAYPWRNGSYKWTAYKATNGTNNAVNKYTIYRNIYDKSASKWLGWVEQTSFAASSLSGSTFEVSFNGSGMDSNDSIKIKITATGKMGDTVTVEESATWATSLATQGFQTANTPPPAPVFDTPTPLTIGSSKIKISAKDTSTAYYNNGQAHLNFYLSTSTTVSTTASATGTYTNTFSYEKDFATSLTNQIGNSIQVYAKTYDGFVYSSANTSKIYQYGSKLIAGSASCSVSLIPRTGSFNFSATKPAVDKSGYYLSTKSTTIRYYISYSSSSGFKELGSKTLSAGTFSVSLSKTRADIINLIGLPANTSSIVYYKVKYEVSGFTAVESSVKNISFDFSAPPIPSLSILAYDGKTQKYYRYNNGSPLGPIANNNITLPGGPGTPYKITYTIGTTSYSTTSISNYVFNTSSLKEGTYSISYKIYETISNKDYLVDSGALSSKFYKGVPISVKPSAQVVNIDDNNFLDGTGLNTVQIDCKASITDKQAYSRNVILYINNTEIVNKTYTSVTQGTATYNNIVITATASENGYCPSNNYKIIQTLFDNNTYTLANGPSININGTNTFKITVNIKELFATSASDQLSSYTNQLSAFNTILSYSASGTLVATALPITEGKTIELYIKQ